MLPSHTYSHHFPPPKKSIRIKKRRIRILCPPQNALPIRIQKATPPFPTFSHGKKRKRKKGNFIKVIIRRNKNGERPSGPFERRRKRGNLRTGPIGSCKNKNRLCSKTCGGYEILVTKVIRRHHFNVLKIEQQLDQECWIPPRRDFIELKSSRRKLFE